MKDDKFFEYSFKDICIPLHSMKHFKEIREIKDPVIKYYEYFALACIEAAKIVGYPSLVSLLLK